MSEPHDVVKLLVARMKSHPEEFKVGGEPFCDRWDEHISDIQAFGNEADVNTLNAKLRDIRLDEIHERVMDELCNGDERRRKEMEEAKYERELMRKVMNLPPTNSVPIGNGGTGTVSAGRITNVGN